MPGSVRREWQHRGDQRFHLGVSAFHRAEARLFACDPERVTVGGPWNFGCSDCSRSVTPDGESNCLAVRSVRSWRSCCSRRTSPSRRIVWSTSSGATARRRPTRRRRSRSTCPGSGRRSEQTAFRRRRAATRSVSGRPSWISANSNDLRARRTSNSTRPRRRRRCDFRPGRSSYGTGMRSRTFVSQRSRSPRFDDSKSYGTPRGPTRSMRALRSAPERNSSASWSN